MICPLRLDIDDFEPGSPTLIDLSMLKKHCRVDANDDNDLLDVYTRAAVLWGEAATHRTIYRRDHRWVLRDFNLVTPYDIRLPRGRTVSIESVECSVNGVTETLYGPSSGNSPAGSDYQEDLRGDGGGVIMPPRGGSWPSVDQDVPAPVVINFTAGWLADEIPANLLHALMFFVADCYDLRGTMDFDPSMLSSAGPRLAARQALVSSEALPRIY